MHSTHGIPFLLSHCNTAGQLMNPGNRQNETGAAIVPVTVLTPQNAFVYRPRDLLISYISGVTATAVCVVVGFACISKASSEAFGTSFSTILRTTRNPQLDNLVSPAETSGSEPLSKPLATSSYGLFGGGSRYRRTKVVRMVILKLRLPVWMIGAVSLLRRTETIRNQHCL